MKALIFAAGLGQRMQPLTQHTPKPLLHAGGKPLIVWHLQKLKQLGIDEVIINTSWLAAQFPAQLGDGSAFGLHLHYSDEGSVPLETGGGMLHALEKLGDAPFLAVNGDIWTDFDFNLLPRTPSTLAHLVLVDNPQHHRQGDFYLDAHGLLHSPTANQPASHTFAGIGVYQPALLHGWRDVIAADADSLAQPPRFKLAPLLHAAMAQRQISGQYHGGQWTDVGTPQRLAALDAALSAQHGQLTTAN